MTELGFFLNFGISVVVLFAFIYTRALPEFLPIEPALIRVNSGILSEFIRRFKK